MVAIKSTSCQVLALTVPQCVQTVNGFLARGPNVPGALTTVSQHQEDAHLALKKTRASLLNFSNGLALALAELAGTADGAVTANKAVKACSKKLKGCWSQWPSAETRLRILLGVPREPEQALSSSSGASSSHLSLCCRHCPIKRLADGEKECVYWMGTLGSLLSLLCTLWPQRCANPVCANPACAHTMHTAETSILQGLQYCRDFAIPASTHVWC